ncbi:MAG: DUF2334 domain-containing protein [Acidimicrobiales bacterium]
MKRTRVQALSRMATMTTILAVLLAVLAVAPFGPAAESLRLAPAEAMRPMAASAVPINVVPGPSGTASPTESGQSADAGGVAGAHDGARNTPGEPNPADMRGLAEAPGDALTAADAPNPGAPTLVLYDNSGEWGAVGELYAQMAANLVSHFGPWVAKPVGEYAAGEMGSYRAVVYVGSTYDEPLPEAFLTDTLAGAVPVLWMYNNIWQLTAHDPGFEADYGWIWAGFDAQPVATVSYKDRNLNRSPDNQSGIMTYDRLDPDRVETPALAVRPDGTRFPWVVRSGNLTYIGELPFAYVDFRDRYLIFADLLFDLLAPDTPERHQALVRIEDVGPNASPENLRSVADALSLRGIPFAVAVYARYVDPHGVFNDGVPVSYSLSDRPEVVDALKYMQSKGGTLLMHGYTHQFGTVDNPYNGVSAADFEFYATHIDENDYVIYDGPVPGDSQQWAAGRIAQAEAEFVAAGLDVPTTFEFPHYAGSVPDYAAVDARFGRRYERSQYYPGYLSGGEIDYSMIGGQYFPYPVTDVYGSFVVPETLGNIIPEPQNNHPGRTPADLVSAAEASLVVRDGYASFFYHPYLGTRMLLETIRGIEDLGYTFVDSTELG